MVSVPESALSQFDAKMLSISVHEVSAKCVGLVITDVDETDLIIL